jgi:CHAT domain-containing protein
VVPHGPFLLERLRQPAPPADGAGPLLAIGAVHYDRAPEDPDAADPDVRVALDRSATEDFAYLKGTQKELEQVRRRAAGRPVHELSGSRASVAAVLRELEKAQWAHLATHGFFADPKERSGLHPRDEDFRRGLGGERIGAAVRNPLLLSGLVLAGAARKKSGALERWAADGGILTGEAVIGLRLEGLRLAVLSACETGLGDVADGEGVFGLQHAFHVAGAADVIASLWKVDDQATAALMNVFYRELWEGKQPPLQALRRAQLYLYYHPTQVAELSRGAPDFFTKTSPLPPSSEPADPPRPGPRAPVKQWAAFVLSGRGR